MNKIYKSNLLEQKEQLLDNYSQHIEIDLEALKQAKKPDDDLRASLESLTNSQASKTSSPVKAKEKAKKAPPKKGKAPAKKGKGGKVEDVPEEPVEEEIPKIDYSGIQEKITEIAFLEPERVNIEHMDPN